MGLLLVIYGAGSIWLDEPELWSASNFTRASHAVACELGFCADSHADSPTSVESPKNEPPSLAEAELVQTPASAYRWSDLADSEIDANRVESARFCERQALSGAPGNPAILFRAANFYLRLQDYTDTLRSMTAVLRNPALAAYYDRVFTIYSHMDMPLETLLNEGIPKTPKAAGAFLDYWIAQNNLDEAQETWKWMRENSLGSVQSAGSYVTLLAKANRWDEAMDSWTALTARMDSEYAKSNWIYDGGFELSRLDCPFDWHFESDGDVQVERDQHNSFRGAASLEVAFHGLPKVQKPVAWQTVLLAPGEWQVSAAIKTEKVTGDQGIFIRVVDQDDPARLNVVTNAVSGTEDWTAVVKTFQVPQGTRAARLEVFRPLANGFEVSRTGRAWIDALDLHPVNTVKSRLLKAEAGDAERVSIKTTSLQSSSFKTGGLAQPGEPCKGHGECGNGEAGFQAASKNRP